MYDNRLKFTYVTDPEKGMSDLTFIEDPQNLLIRWDKLPKVDLEYLYKEILENVDNSISKDVAIFLKDPSKYGFDIDEYQIGFLDYDLKLEENYEGI